ncbi:probable pectinesterase/pectinesterase inhibitor 20 [Mercurialis annua]|uniref:probable pectinesterase/pectinesterase inhibitor 20 n=1 Tax=Mercurialis annua TaxID=3986 RepID=UPI00215F0E45|nr:probable pectinesterase/pectinesterase inhibitor 20 [Mercurialis annua]
MASNLSILTIIFILYFSSSSSSMANLLPPIFNTPETLCTSTPNPLFCKSFLPYNKPGTIHDYAKISISLSLTNSINFLSLVQSSLTLIPSSSYQSAVYALEDCQFLAQLNIDSLSYALDTINSSNDNNLQLKLSTDLLTFLSATLTNQETCLEGLKSTSTAPENVLNGLLGHLLDGKNYFSTSLALFNQGWIPKLLQGKLPTEGLVRSLPFGRKLLQEFTNGVFVRTTVVVNPYGGGDFNTISDAVAAAPNNTVISDGYYVIYVVAGVYNEYVVIDKKKKFLMMIGDGINQTIITGNKNFVDGWTTFNSATFVAVGQGFVAVNITIQNTSGPEKHQAVALRNGADLSAFYKCSFEGYQDTLYTHSLRQFYRDCEIYGTIDFIFGNAAVVLQNCIIISRLPMSNQFNTITAQGRIDPNQNTGTSIQNCTIIAAQDLASSNIKTYLGRPWKEYSRTVVMQSFIDGLIDPTGWAPWSGDFALATLYYAEFDNYGPGSDVSMRVDWPGYDRSITAAGAVNYTVWEFIQGDGWLPATGVPYFGSL